MTVEVRFYPLDEGRSQPLDFLRALPARERATIEADLQTLGRHEGRGGPLSLKPIKGHSPMWELRTWGYRTLFFHHEGSIVVLHVCKKQDQRAGIEAAARRMKQLRR
jgi:phage-related protein